MCKKNLLMFAACIFSIAAAAQQTKTAPVTITQPAAAAQPSFAFKKINPLLSYAFILDKPTSTHPQEGDQIMINMQSVHNNRILYNSLQVFKGKPAVFGVAKPAFKGDLIEAIMLMTPGDSMVCQADADAIFKNSKTKMPDFIKKGDKIQYYLKLVSIKPKEQVQKEQQAAFMKQMKEQQEKQKAAEAKQLIKDDKTLKAWFAKNHLTPVKTASGLYYTIKEEGSGEKALAGDSISMNYTGTLLDGTKFDSNEDTAFHHVQPLNFVLGRGAVIKGWDEGVALLKTGAKATFYIPSPLAYAQQSRPGSAANPKGIPPNSILLFDVHLLSNKHLVPVAAPAPKLDSLKAPQLDSLKTPPAPPKEEKH